MKELFLIIVANTLLCNSVTTLQRNLEGGHFYDVILQQYCKYIAQSIYNIITLQ